MQAMHIDVGAILRASLNPVYTDLVTRSTGRTVRSRIEQCMAEGHRPGAITVIDFSRIGLLDFSCADEIVANLMRQCCAQPGSSDFYLLFAGISEAHLDAIEQVLERQRLALIVRITERGIHRLVGVVDEVERVVWETVVRCQPVTAEMIATEAGIAEEEANGRLISLHRRRLLMRVGAEYRAPIGAVA